MESNRFDDLARTLATGVSRRTALKGAVGGLLGALGLGTGAAAQVSQAQCGNQFCASDPGACAEGCVCCLYRNSRRRVTNSRCRPPGSCGPGEAVCPTGEAPDPMRGCVARTCTDAECDDGDPCTTNACTPGDPAADARGCVTTLLSGTPCGAMGAQVCCAGVCCTGTGASCGGGGTPGVCGCTPRTCTPGQCGAVTDGCGGTLQCGGCAGGQTCGGGGTPGICGSCVPECAGSCGGNPDGCGGTCPSPCPVSGQSCCQGTCSSAFVIECFGQCVTCSGNPNNCSGTCNISADGDVRCICL